MNPVPPSRFARPVEWALLIAIVLIAIVFRFTQFGSVPPGLHYDEAIDAKLAQDIRSGVWPIYFEEGWGREPLYHYLVALTLNIIPDPASALRAVSGALGLIQLVAAYFLFRELFGVPTALIGAAWIAVLFWTVSTSRAGLRNIALATLTTLTALAFWKTMVSGQWAAVRHSMLSTGHWSFITGLLLGLTLYTYQPSRVVPLIFLAFAVYLFFTNRSLVASRWKPLLIFFLVAAVIAVPLVNFLATHPDAETGRAFQTEPIRELLRGDPAPVLETTVATLKMFTFEGGGDSQPIYNVSGRPLFIGSGSILFYLGLLVCLVRWRQPAYAFVLIWLIITLLPNLLTAPAPFFYRAIAAQTPVLVLPAIGTVALGELFNRKGRDPAKRSGAGGRKEDISTFLLRPVRSLPLVVPILVAAISLGQTAVTTQHDYFEVWGRDPAVRFQYSAAHTAIARVLDASPDTTPVALSGYFIEDADPYVFAQTLHRSDLTLRWFDARDALLAIEGASTQRLALPSFTPLDANLRSLIDATPIEQARDYTLTSFDAAAFRTEIAQWGGLAQTPGGASASLPISFDGNISLLGYRVPVSISRAGSTLMLLTAWRVTGEWQPSPTAIFAHLLDADGKLIAQDDRLGFPRHNWQAGDEFVQVHRIPLGDAPPGRYTLQVGVYTREGGSRWIARDAADHEIGDRVRLAPVEVKP